MIAPKIRYLAGWIGIASLLLVAVPATAAVKIEMNNVDPDQEGLNDSTPVAPIGGNPGETLGEQRLKVLEFAADLWGSILEGNVDIVVQVTFGLLPCSPTTAVLGAAGPVRVFANFPTRAEAVVADTWYHAALASQLAGFDLTPGPPDPNLLAQPFRDDMVAYFNGGLDGDTGCLSGNWYYGFDNAPPPGDIALLNVVMHEFAHGLGLTSFIDETSGETPLELPDRYSMFTLDTTTGKHFHEMSSAERLDSQVSRDAIVWDGPATTQAAPHILNFQAELVVTSPSSLVGRYPVVGASFGPAPTPEGISGTLDLVDDTIGDVTDGCEPIAANMKGKIALASRGNCPFIMKVVHAEAAGAQAVLIANNRPGGTVIMEGNEFGSTIPAAGISQDQAEALHEALQRADVRATLRLNPDRLVGANAQGFVQLYAPDPIEPGSSLSHLDPQATPDLLMEPFISGELNAAQDVDITPFLLQDLGWTLAAEDAAAEDSE